MRRTLLAPLSIHLLLAGPAATAQTLPDSLRSKVHVEERLLEQTQQSFQLHLISAGARLDAEAPGWILDVKVIASETAPEWVTLSMVVSQPIARNEKPKKRMSTSELESGAWIRDYVVREMVDPRIIQQHAGVLVRRPELEAAVTELVGRFSEQAIEPMRRFWLERQHRE